MYFYVKEPCACNKMLNKKTTDETKAISPQKRFLTEVFKNFSLLWPKATTFDRLQSGYSWTEAATVQCGQRPQHLKSHSGQNTWHPCPIY